ncbi:peptide-methionine (S)-S-oxide reductase [Leptolyngbya sp. GB1-A1]
MSTSVGYMGGHFEHPSYLDVLSRITGHAEVCQVEYDPSRVSYDELLALFWQIHDPTSLNRQDADRGEHIDRSFSTTPLTKRRDRSIVQRASRSLRRVQQAGCDSD